MREEESFSLGRGRAPSPFSLSLPLVSSREKGRAHRALFLSRPSSPLSLSLPPPSSQDLFLVKQPKVGAKRRGWAAREIT